MTKRREFLLGVAAAGSLYPVAAIAAGQTSLLKQMNSAASAALRKDLANGGNLAPPPKHFSSNHNYFIYGGGQPLVGLVVTIEINEDLVAPTGISLQLNGYSSMSDSNSIYQQYVTGLSPNNPPYLRGTGKPTPPTLLIGWSMENWPSDQFRAHLHDTIGLHAKGDIFNKLGVIGVYPSPKDRIPAGFKIKYELLTGTNDKSGKIIGATYSVTDDKGKVKTSGPQLIKDFKFDGVDKFVGPAAISPVLALQMNLCGLNGGRFMKMNSGAGTITYQASSPLTAEATAPATIAHQKTFTKETSNIVYDQVAAGPQNTIVQPFHAKV